MIIRGDCIEEMKKLEENSVDAIVTDPPYGLEFMGKDWDKGVPGVPFWEEMLRVLKPGGFLLSFGGTRTYHRMACGIEDAGFEIRDCIMWLYGSGFPKSLNIGKQIDKIQGVEQKQEEYEHPQRKNRSANYTMGFSDSSERKNEGGSKIMRGVATSPEAKEWEGWGTALKPACEPIVVARKPLSEKNVALNVLKWGTGGINIDACRVEGELPKEMVGQGFASQMKTNQEHGFRPKDYYENQEGFNYTPNQQGRFPANIILDEEAGEILDEQSGNLGQGHWSKTKTTGFGEFGGGSSTYEGVGEKDKSKHGASRFFYCAKSSKSERNSGMEEKQTVKQYEEKQVDIQQPHNSKDLEERYAMTSKNNHPTVKPIKLMEYLIKLISKEKSIVLDPFTGSGTTGIACAKLNRQFIGFEKEEEYVKIAEARIKPFKEQSRL